MQHSARHKPVEPATPITWRKVARLCVAVVGVGTILYATGVGVWPAIAGGLGNLSVMIWQSRTRDGGFWG